MKTGLFTYLQKSVICSSKTSDRLQVTYPRGISDLIVLLCACVSYFPCSTHTRTGMHAHKCRHDWGPDVTLSGLLKTSGSDLPSIVALQWMTHGIYHFLKQELKGMA